MTTAAAPVEPTTAELTAADVLRRFGPIPLRRVRLHPYPATVADVAKLHTRHKRLFELIDGTLVEKDYSYPAAYVATTIATHLGNFAGPRGLGAVAGSGGMMQVAPGRVRIPDVSFCTWEQFPNRKVSLNPVPHLHPDLAGEVLRGGNTTEEMDEKLRDYFSSGATLVWLVDPFDRTVLVFTSPDRSAARRLTAADTLDGGTVLPGFSTPVAALFADLEAP